MEPELEPEPPFVILAPAPKGNLFRLLGSGSATLQQGLVKNYLMVLRLDFMYYELATFKVQQCLYNMYCSGFGSGSVRP